MIDVEHSATRRRMRLRTRVGMVTLLVVTGGCGSPAGKATTKAASTNGALTVTDLLNGGDEQAQRRHFRHFQEIMTACMKKDGWDYTPIDADTVFLDPQQFNSDLPAVRAKYGFGISIEVAPDTPPVDLNRAYMESLDETKVHLYIQSQNICGEEASKDRGDPPMQNPAISAAVDRFDAEMTNDPRYRAAQAKWSACMQQHGYTYKDDSAIVSDLKERLGILSVIAAAAPPPSPGQPTLSVYDAVGIKPLQQIELAIAKADSECSAKDLAKLTHDISVKQAAELLKQFPELAPK
jgi:hypothetical protein